MHKPNPKRKTKMKPEEAASIKVLDKVLYCHYKLVTLIEITKEGNFRFECPKGFGFLTSTKLLVKYGELV